MKNLGVTNSVEFAGHLSQRQLFARVSQVNLFVLASESKADNLPNSVKEAMALGIPAVTTPTTGLSEFVQHNFTGCVVPTANAEAVANAIIRIISDQRFAEQLAQEAIRSVGEKFDIRRTTEQRKMVYSILTQSPGFSLINDRETTICTAEDLECEQLNRGLST